MKNIRFGLFLLDILFLLICIIPCLAYADPPNCRINGKVIKVVDGDTLIVLDEKKSQHKIRLAGIDAPERGQPFGKKSKKYLQALVKNSKVCVDWHKLDKYGNKIGIIILGKAELNYKMINKGLAWHYKVFQYQQSKYEREKYTEAEIDAKLAGIGLWSEPNAIPPWEWRKGSRPLHLTKLKKQQIIQLKRRSIPKQTNFTCGSKRFCTQMISCSEAYFYFNTCDLYRLDGDHDGIPCESFCR